MTKNRIKATFILSLVLALVSLVFVCSLPNFSTDTALAVGHAHHYCGKTECTHSVCNKSSVEYTDLTQAMIEGLSTAGEGYAIPAGNYVLAENIDISSALVNALTIDSSVEVSLCLNGFTLKCTTVTDKGNLFLCDCSAGADGKVILTNYAGISNENQFVMYSGIVESIATVGASYNNNSGAIYAKATSSTTIIYGGEVKSTGGNSKISAIYVAGSASNLKIYDGVISSTVSTAIRASGTCSIDGGRIEGAPGGYSYSNSDGTTTVSGGTFVGRIFTGTVDVYKHYLIIVGSNAIQNDGIHLSKLPGSGVYYIDAKEYSGPSTFAISLSESTISDMVSLAHANNSSVEKMVARGSASKLTMDSTRNPDWQLVNGSEGGNTVVKLKHIGHSGGEGTATCSAGKTCETCRQAYGDVDPTVHASDSIGYRSNDDGTHDKVYMCCGQPIEENITCTPDPDRNYSCDDEKKCQYCSYVLEPAGEHNYDGYVVFAKFHYQKCEDCYYSTDYTPHVYDDSYDVDCNVCGGARTEGYDITVGSIEVTDENKNDVLGDLDEGATVTYDSDTDTLILNNANLSPDTWYGIEGYDYLNDIMTGIKIHLIGNNVISVSGWEEARGISAGSIIFSADVGGTLDIRVSDDATLSGCGISAEVIYIDSGEVTVSGDMVAMICATFIGEALSGSLTFDSVDLTDATVGAYQGVTTVLVGTEPAKTAVLTPQYRLIVGGISVTAENKNDIFGDAATNGGIPTAKYDLATNTLTLCGANIIATEGSGMAIGSVMSESGYPLNLNLHLVGNSLIYGAEEMGIFAKDLTVTAETGGTLTVNDFAYGVLLEDGNFVVKSGEVVINATEVAVMVNRGEILADRHVLVGSVVQNDPDLVLGTTGTISEVCSVFIGGHEVSNAAKTLRIYPHVHAWETEYTKNATHHWHECTAIGCYATETSEKDGYAEHSAEHDDGNCTTAEFCVCGELFLAVSEHTFDNGCDTTCNKCNYTRDPSHTPNDDDGDCTTDITCSVCHEVLTERNDSHDFGGDYLSDSAGHWHKCAHCTVTDTKAGHDQESDDGDCTTDVLCSICDYAIVKGNASHTWSGSYLTVNSDETKHYHVCTVSGCTEKDDGENHTPNIPSATEQSAKFCTVCQYVIEVQLGHTHVYGEVVDDHYKISDATCLTQATYHESCSCGEIGAEEFSYGAINTDNHVGTPTKLVKNDDGTHDLVYTCCNAVVEDNVTCVATDIDGTCLTAEICICGYVLKGANSAHEYESEYTKDSSGHWHECVHCTVTDTKAVHDQEDDDGDCTTDVLCSICDYAIVKGNASHTWSGSYLTVNSDETKHYHVCTVSGCTEKDDGENHTPNIPSATEQSAKFCTVCQYVMEAQLGHTHVYGEVVDDHYKVSDATCLTQATYYKSCSCGQKGSETFVVGEIDSANHESENFLYESDDSGKHAKKHACCGALASNEDCSFGANNICAKCGYEKKYTVTVVNGTAGEGNENSVTVNADGTVTVKPTIPEGKVFLGWAIDGNVVSTEAEYTFSVTENATLTALFGDKEVVEPNDTLSGGAIAGIVIGCVVGAGGIAVAVIFLLRKKKK